MKTMPDEPESPTMTFQPERAPRQRCPVRVDIRDGHAVLTPEGGKFPPVAFPATMLSPRMRRGETRVYFDAWIRNGAIEIGERLPAAKGGW